MPFPDLPPERIPGSPGHLNDHQLIDQALDYVKQSAYRDDPNFPPLPDIPVLGQSGHVTAHDRILAVLQYVKANPPGPAWATISNTPTGTYQGDDGHTYAYYEFTTSGTLTVITAGLVDLLVVGGGGAGNTDQGKGGGGAGGVLQVSQGLLPAGSLPVTVGAGGPAFKVPANYYSRRGDDGEASVVGNYVAAGGGGAGCINYRRDGIDSVKVPGGNGGSGGGYSGKGIPGQGHNGANQRTGGGGGAGGPGSGENGGPGITSSITGEARTFGVGGPQGNGTANTGNGGKSGGSFENNRSGAGGSGIVIVRTRLN